MSTKKEETASFVVRFTQKILKDESGDPKIQWRGNIRHVQEGDEKRFSEFEEVISFMQEKLASMALDGTDDPSVKERKNDLASSFDRWRQMAQTTPKKLIETILDPKKQLAEIQGRVQEVNENIKQNLSEVTQNVEIDKWRTASKSDFKQIMDRINQLGQDVKALHDKVDQLNS
ncbi:MAG: hypothetical protein AAF598_11705 [Bacteroidota bacterium]